MTPSKFRRLGATAKRKLIIRDVLEQLRRRKYKATNGWYVAMSAGIDYWGNQALDIPTCLINREQLVGTRPPSCHVCATGSLFLSSIRAANTFEGKHVTNFKVMKQLAPYFSPGQLVLIEAAFERTSDPALGQTRKGITAVRKLDGTDAVIRAENFGRRYDDATPRLRAILKNMLKHKGIFTP